MPYSSCIEWKGFQDFCLKVMNYLFWNEINLSTNKIKYSIFYGELAFYFWKIEIYSMKR